MDGELAAEVVQAGRVARVRRVRVRRGVEDEPERARVDHVAVREGHLGRPDLDTGDDGAVRAPQVAEPPTIPPLQDTMSATDGVVPGFERAAFIPADHERTPRDADATPSPATRFQDQGRRSRR
jgi:hypothetical protein